MPLAILLATANLLALLATSAQPWVPDRRPATAEQVEAARGIFRTARTSRKTGRPSALTLNEADLDSVAALVSQGFAPLRADAGIDRGTLQLTLSRPVLFRWLNIRARLDGSSGGFPAMQVRIGVFDLPPWLVRFGIGIGRQVLALRGAQLPPLDHLVQSTDIGPNSVRAEIMLPRTGLIDRAVGDKTVTVDPAVVGQTYCRLAELQQAAPERLFARQLARALALAEDDPASNGAALIALAMLVVDAGIGELAGDVERQVSKCMIAPVAASLHGRTDLAKHWALSAALTVTAGSRFATAMGEWKELADSLSGSQLNGGNARSGFSFVDLAADRAGHLSATALVNPELVQLTRGRLTGGAESAILPPSALALAEGIPNDDFVQRYGATDDPRFLAEVDRIDAMLVAAGIE